MVPAFAAVRPRVFVAEEDDPRLLEDVVAELAEDQPAGVAWTIGGPRSGKTTALCHLAALFGQDERFRGATFHMGSSRSGLVGSPIACEGSKTGFYTDELEEVHFRPPEEVRKANLQSADLRGAKIDAVDFYLVDLRDARLDPAQFAQAHRTGAILDADA